MSDPFAKPAKYDLEGCLQKLADRCGLAWDSSRKHFAGLYRGVGLDAWRSEDTLRLAFYSPTVNLGDEILADFAGFGHCKEGGLPTDWVEAIMERTKDPHTPYHPYCLLRIGPERMERIGVDRLMEIPELVARDYHEHGATDAPKCERCNLTAPTGLLVINGVHSLTCDACRREAELDAAKKRKTLLRNRYAVLAAAAVVVVYVAISLLKPTVTGAFDRGLEAYGKGDYDAAICYFTEAIRLDPGYANIYQNRGSAYIGKGQYDLAIADCSKAIELNPRLAEAYHNRGLAYLYKGQYDPAIADYTRAIQLNPQIAEAYYNRGLAHVSKGEYDPAIADYTRAIELKWREAWRPYYNRGVAYGNKGEYDLAIRDYTKAIELKPDLLEAHFNRALAHFEKGEYDLAIRDCTKVIELRPDFADAYCMRGGAYGRKDEYGLAIADCTKAIELRPDLGGAYYNRAVVRHALKDYDRAWADVKKCRELGVTPDPKFIEELTRASGRSE